MSFEIETVSSYQRRIQFVVPGPEVAKKLDAAYKKLGGRVRIPGFRPGKVPRKMLETRFGEQVRSDVANELINMNFQGVAPKIEFIGQPQVEPFDMPQGGDFRFAVTVQVKPSVEISDYTGIRVEFPAVDVPDADVEQAVERRLASKAKLTDVVSGAIERGNLVLVEIKDGETVLEAGTLVNTGADKYYPGIEALLVGKNKGDVVTGHLTAASGRSFDATITVLGIQAMKAPALTDELATELGYEGGVEAMKAALRMDLDSKATEAARNQARINLLQALVAKHPVEVPPAIVEKNLRLLLEELSVQAQYRGRDPRSIRYSDAQMDDLRNRASFASKAGLLLEAIAGKEGIRITDEDLEAKYQEIADLRGQRVEAIKGYIQKDGAVSELRRHLLEERTLDWLLEHSELVTPEAPAAPAVETPAAEEKPKKAARKAKEAEEAPATEAPAAEAPAAEEKPKKAAKKAKAADEAPAEAAAEATEEPKAKKAKAKKKEE